MEEFKEFFIKEPSLTTIIKYTKQLGFSKKLISKRNENSFNLGVKLERKRVVSRMIFLEKAKSQIIYIDETRFNIDMVPKRGISKKNTKCLIKAKNKGLGITAICAINSRAIVGLQFFIGGVTAKDFGCFMVNLINKNENIKNNLSKFHFFMDNAAIHKNKFTKSFFENINIIYNAPYSSDLNPIENIFGIVKAKFRKLNIYSDVEITTKIISSFKYISSLNIEWTLFHSYYFYEKAFNLEDI